MRGAEGVVGRLRALREAREAVVLSQRGHALAAPRQDLVGVGLMADVPDDAVLGRVERRVNRDGELRRAKQARKMASRLRDGLDHERAELLSELRELVHVEPAQVRRRADGVEKRLLSHLRAAYM